MDPTAPLYISLGHVNRLAISPSLASILFPPFILPRQITVLVSSQIATTSIPKYKHLLTSADHV